MRKIWTPSIELPHILRQDERVDAARQALEKALADLSKAARECLFLPRLDELTGDVLDVLANQYHTDFFEPTMSDELKRFMIRDAIRFHRIKGTPQAVEEIMRQVYRNARVEEWFEYGGEPYFFRIKQDITDTDELTDQATLDRAREIVKATKNARSWLEYFCFGLTFKDEVEPTDDSWHFEIKESYHDWYDYRRNNDRHDGVADYGASLWHHDGQYSRNGRLTRKGVESRARHGRFQASDFEHIRLILDIEPTADTIEPREDFGRIQQGVRIRDRADEQTEIGALHLTQRISRNGHYKRNETITHGGSVMCDVTFLPDEERERWAQKKATLKTTFSEPCPDCGASDYNFQYGSARFGSDVFIITDPQLLTVDVRCNNCGGIIAQYLIESEEWRAYV